MEVRLCDECRHATTSRKNSLQAETHHGYVIGWFVDVGHSRSLFVAEFGRKSTELDTHEHVSHYNPEPLSLIDDQIFHHNSLTVVCDGSLLV